MTHLAGFLFDLGRGIGVAFADVIVEVWLLTKTSRFLPLLLVCAHAYILLCEFRVTPESQIEVCRHFVSQGSSITEHFQQFFSDDYDDENNANSHGNVHYVPQWSLHIYEVLSLGFCKRRLN